MEEELTRYQKIAIKIGLIGEDEQLYGDGKYASVSNCDPERTVYLYETLPEAEEAKTMIDRHGCGHLCNGNHALVDLDFQRNRHFGEIGIDEVVEPKPLECRNIMDILDYDFNPIVNSEKNPAKHSDKNS